jgi:hypothetical protein
MTRPQQSQQGKSVDPRFETLYDECFSGENIATFFIRAFAYAPLTLPPVLVTALAILLVVRKARRRAAAGLDE